MTEAGPAARALAAVRTTIFTFFFIISTLIFTLLATLAIPFGARAVGWAAAGWSYAHIALSRVILGQKVVIEGVLPPDVRFVVAKHEAMFETIDALRVFDRPVIAAKKELLALPLWGWAAARYGLVSVNRGGGASALRTIRVGAKAAMKKGRVFIIYAEGTRVRHGEAPPLKPGFVALYAMFNMPVVPVAIDSGRLNPRDSWLRFPGTITYRFGAPIPPGLPREEVEARAHAAINALNS